MESTIKIQEILAKLCGTNPEELSADLDLFEAGLLDSFGVIELILSLEETFGVSLPIETIPRTRLATPQSIAELVREAGEAI